MARMLAIVNRKEFDTAQIELSYDECMALNFVLRNVGGSPDTGRGHCERVMQMLQRDLGMPTSTDVSVMNPVTGTVQFKF